jgi:hypothetical protein
MKKLILLAAIAVLALGLMSCDRNAEVIEPNQSTTETTVEQTTTVQVTIVTSAATVTTAIATTVFTQTEREPFENEFFIEVVEPKYDFIWDFSEGLARVRLGDKWGYIDKTGKEVIPLQYTGATSFSDGVAWVILPYSDKWGLIDKQGNQVLPFEYYAHWYSSIFSYGLSAVQTGRETGEYVFIDKTGKRVTSVYDFVRPFSEGFAAVVVERDEETGLLTKHRYIDKTGKYISSATDFISYRTFQDDGIRLYFSEGLAPFRKDGKFGFIDRRGRMVIPPVYDYVQGFSDGLSVVWIDGKSGYIDKNGKMVIELNFEEEYRWIKPGAFSDGLASVIKSVGEWEGKVGYIDKSGKVVIDFIYDAIPGHGYTANEFREGFAVQLLGEKYGIIDKAGNIVVPFVYEEIHSISEGMASVSISGRFQFSPKKWGVIQIKS